MINKILVYIFKLTAFSPVLMIMFFIYHDIIFIILAGILLLYIIVFVTYIIPRISDVDFAFININSSYNYYHVDYSMLFLFIVSCLNKVAGIVFIAFYAMSALIYNKMFYNIFLNLIGYRIYHIDIGDNTCYLISNKSISDIKNKSQIFIVDKIENVIFL